MHIIFATNMESGAHPLPLFFFTFSEYVRSRISIAKIRISWCAEGCFDSMPMNPRETKGDQRKTERPHGDRGNQGSKASLPASPSSALKPFFGGGLPC